MLDISDLDWASEMVVEFLDKHYPELNKEGSLVLLNMALKKENDMFAIGKKDEALLVACIPEFNVLFHPKKCGIEMLFYSRKSGEGKRLLKEYEEYARSVGCSFTTLSVYSSETKVHDYYQRLGYSPYETNFKKVL